MNSNTNVLIVLFFGHFYYFSVFFSVGPPMEIFLPRPLEGLTKLLNVKFYFTSNSQIKFFSEALVMFITPT